MKKELKLGVVLSYISMVLGYIVSMLYIPILLKMVGKGDYGLYNLVLSFISYLGLLTLGIGSSYMRYYSKYKYEEREDKIANLNSVFISIFSVISFIALLVGIYFSFQITEIFQETLSFAEIKKAEKLMRILTINTIFSFINIVFDCYIIAHEKYTYQKIIQMIRIVINPLVVLPLLYLGYGIVALGIGTTFLNMLLIISNIVYCIKKLKMQFLLNGIEKNFIKDIFAFSIYIFIYMLIDQINWNIDKFLLGKYKGTAEVAIYSVGAQLNSYVIQLSLVVSSVFIPYVNNIVARDPYSKELTEIFVNVGKVQYFIISLLFTGFLFFGESFLNIWAGKGFKNSFLVGIILILPMNFVVIQNLGIEIRKAQNKHKIPTYFMLVVSIFNFLISIPLIKRYGAIGGSLATSISIIINQIFINYYYKKFIKLDIRLFWNNIIKISKGLFFPIIFGIILSKLKNNYSYSDIVFLMFIPLYILVYFLSFYFLGLQNIEKQKVLKVITNKVRRC